MQSQLSTIKHAALYWKLFKDLIGHPEKIKIIRYNKKFNYSAINNFAAAWSKADIIVLVNNDVEVISENWLSEMVSHD